MNSKLIFLLTGISISILVGLYSVYASYAVFHFSPEVDTSGYIVDFISSIKPEIEIPLYQKGWIFLFATTPILFFILSKIIVKFAEKKEMEVAHILFRLIVIATLIILFIAFKMVVPPFILGLIYIMVYVVIMGVCFYIGRSKFAHKTRSVIDCCIGGFLTFLSVYLIHSLFQPIFEQSLVLVFQEYTHSFLVSLPIYKIGVTALVIFIYLSLLYLSLKKEKLLNHRLFDQSITILVVIGITWAVLLYGLPARNGYLFNYVAITGPINDILQGRILLFNTTSHYGLLMTYTLSLFFLFIELNYINMSLLVVASYILGYLAIYFILKRWVNTIAALGILIFVILEHYFTNGASVLCCANISFLRFGWWIVLAVWFLFSNNLKLPPIKKRFIELLLVGYSFYWAIDVGTYTLLSYVGYLVVSCLNETSSLRHALKMITVRFFGLVSVLLFYTLAISLYTYLNTGSIGNWSFFYGEVGDYIIGMDLLPLPQFGPYQILIAILLISVCYILSRIFSFLKTSKRDQSDNFELFSFLTFYSLFSLLYYLGRSGGGSIHTLIIPFVLIAVWLCKKWFSQLYPLTKWKNFSLETRFIFSSSLILMFICLSILVAAAYENIKSAYPRHADLYSLPKIAEETTFTKSLEAIEQELANKKGEKREVALVTTYDTEYLIRAHATNVMDLNLITNIRTKKQIQEIGQQLIDRNPSVVFAEHNVSSTLVHTLIQDFISKKYKIDKRVGNLDRWILQ